MSKNFEDDKSGPSGPPPRVVVVHSDECHDDEVDDD